MARKPPTGGSLEQRRHQWELARDVTLFGCGIVGVFYQLIIGKTDPSLLVIFAAMLGLPFTIGARDGR
jgi:hypothetical protein